jgi:hypothetical protein
MFRAGGPFVGITFNDEGKIRERGVFFGSFAHVADDIERCALNNYRIGGAVISSPAIFPQELSDLVRDALALRLGWNMKKILAPHEAAAWCK